LNEIIGEVAEKTALNKFILAGFYEENNLFIDAIAAYEDAIKLAPDVPSYKDAYEEFLMRHGMKRQ
jgi:cytochrome c-type biogenesis protein CcmH/NrfG